MMTRFSYLTTALSTLLCLRCGTKVGLGRDEMWWVHGDAHHDLVRSSTSR